MDLERALETQRIKLLRLLTGWIAVAGFVSCGSFVLPLPQELRRFFDSLLTRAELAGQYLARASECLQGRNGRVVSDGPLSPSPSHANDDAPSCANLVRRMEALRDLLDNLTWEKPRARRTGRRVTRYHDCEKRIGFVAHPLHAANRAIAKPEPHAPRAEHPPDRVQDFQVCHSIFTPSRKRGGRRRSLPYLAAL